MSRDEPDRNLRYQAHDRLPGGLALGSGAQLVVLGIIGLVAFSTVVTRTMSTWSTTTSTGIQQEAATCR